MTLAVLLSGPRGLEWAGFTLADKVQQTIFFAAHGMDPGAGTSRAMFGWGDAPTPSMTAEDVAAAIGEAKNAKVEPVDIWNALVAAVDSARY